MDVAEITDGTAAARETGGISLMPDMANLTPKPVIPVPKPTIQARNPTVRNQDITIPNRDRINLKTNEDGKNRDSETQFINRQYVMS